MRRLCALLILASSLFSCIGTLAEGGDSFDIVNIPKTVKTFIDSSRWNGWEITGWVNPKELRSDTACAFAVVKSGSKNDMLAFRWRDGDWEYYWHNASALPQVEEPVMLAELETGEFVSCYVFNEEILETHCLWKQKGDGTWHLQHLYNYYPLMFFDTSIENALRVYNTGWTNRDIDEWVYGTYQTNLRYFNLSIFPKTVAEAKEKLSNPPKIPAGTLSAEKIQFTSGQKHKVFQGPGEEYGQASNGKAIVSTNDWIQVFGEENGWILIQYDIASDHMRIGWIAADALPHNAVVSELVFSPVGAITSCEVNLTDDPLNSQVSIATFAQGVNVNWLATMGEWAYIENIDNQLVRGFVKIGSLEIETEAQ